LQSKKPNASNVTFFSACDDFDMLKELSSLIQIWETQAIFAKSFCDLLQSYLRPKIDAALSKRQQFSSYEMQTQEII